MKNKGNKGKKVLTAVGAVVAAGLTPGIIAATPGCLPGPDPNAAITAASVVAIDGNAYDFDELYAMQQGANRDSSPQVATRYGVQPTKPAPRPFNYQPPEPKQQQQPMVLLDTIQMRLGEYCAMLLEDDGRYAGFSLDSDLTRDMGMDDAMLKELALEIKERYGVDLSYNRFKLVGQLNTLRRVSLYIYRLKTVWD